MRVIVFFDLPVKTALERKAYTRFRKYLMRSGFMMMQYSVYCKLALNMTAANVIMENVRQKKPKRGLIHMLVVTEKQFSRMEIVLGEFRTEVINSDERLVIL
jgi:CRISPR-associated protein Cas2